MFLRNCALLILTGIIVKLIFDEYKRRHVPLNRDFSKVNSGRVKLEDAELSFLSYYTGITDLEALRKHVHVVWKQVGEERSLHICRSEKSLFAT